MREWHDVCCFLCSSECIVLLCFTDGGKAAVTCSLLRDDGLLDICDGSFGLVL